MALSHILRLLGFLFRGGQSDGCLGSCAWSWTELDDFIKLCVSLSERRYEAGWVARSSRLVAVLEIASARVTFRRQIRDAMLVFLLYVACAGGLFGRDRSGVEAWVEMGHPAPARKGILLCCWTSAAGCSL